MIVIILIILGALLYIITCIVDMNSSPNLYACSIEPTSRLANSLFGNKAPQNYHYVVYKLTWYGRKIIFKSDNKIKALNKLNSIKDYEK